MNQRGQSRKNEAEPVARCFANSDTLLSFCVDELKLLNTNELSPLDAPQLSVARSCSSLIRVITKRTWLCGIDR